MTEPEYRLWAERLLTEVYELDLTREQQKQRITETLEAVSTQRYWQGKRHGREEYAAELWESGVLGQSEEHVRKTSPEDEARIQKSLGLDIINDFNNATKNLKNS